MSRKNCEKCKGKKATISCNGHHFCEKCFSELMSKRKTIIISNNIREVFK